MGIDQAVAFAPAERSHSGIIALIALGQVIVSIDFCVSSIALASIGHGYTVSAEALPLVVTVFSLAYGGFLIFGGRIADLFGQRRAFIAGLMMFGLGSILVAVSPNFTFLIAMRALEGLGGALLTPTSFSLINVALPDGPVRHRAYSVFGVTQGLSYILAIYAGGAIVSAIGWRFCFLLNLPFMAVAMVLSRHIPTQAKPVSRVQIDFLGALLITAGIGLLMFGLSAMGKVGLFSPRSLLPLAGSALCLVILAYVESRAAQPLVPPALLRYPNVVGGNLACILLISGGSSVFVMAPLFLQQVFHFNAATSGLAMMPYNAAVVVGGQFAGFAMSRLSLRACIAAGAALFVAGTVSFWFLGQGSSFPFLVLPSMLLAAAGATIASLAVMALSTGAVAAEAQGIASAVLMTCQQIGVALGVSGVFAIMATASRSGASIETTFHQAFFASTLFALASVAVVFSLSRTLPVARPSTQ